MENVNIGQRVKELRNSLGLSQVQLADQTQLSLRTIQRVENNEVDPRGDTLNRLSKVLNIPAYEQVNYLEKNDNTYLALVNLSALSFFIFPLLGIIFPIILWSLKREKIMHLDETAKKLLNFQITWCILLSLFYLWMIAGMLFPIDFSFRIGRPELSILLISLLYIVNLTLVLINTVRSSQAKRVFYAPAIPFLR